MKKFCSILLICSIFTGISTTAMANKPHEICVAASNKNILGFGDFEKDVDFTGKLASEASQHSGIKGYSNDAYCGKASLELYHNNSYYPMSFRATVGTGSLYKFSAWVKLKELDAGVTTRTDKTNVHTMTTNFYTVVKNADGTVKELKKRWGNYTYPDQMDKVQLNTTEWKLLECVFYAPQVDNNTTLNVKIGAVTGQVRGYYIDDVCLEKIGDVNVEVTGQNSIEIPKENESAVTVDYTAKIMGASMDLTAGVKTAMEITPVLKLKENYTGVSFDGKTLTVDNTAYERKIVLVATAGYNKCEYPITLTYTGDKKPQVRGIKLDGNVKPGETLSISYNYYDPTGLARKEETLLWQGRNSEEEDWTTILKEGIPASENSLVITSEFPYSMVRCIIAVKNTNDVSSGEFYSNIAIKPAAPEARNITVKGNAFVGEKLEADYEWYDVNDLSKEKRGTDIYQWYRFSSADISSEREIIGNATACEYVVSKDDADKFLRFSVIPVSLEDPFYDSEKVYYSDPIQGPLRPIAKNVEIIKYVNGNVLTGYYDYLHPQNIKEGVSKYAWYLDGKLVSTEITYTVPENTSGSVCFEVTPVAEKEPIGKAVSSKAISVNTKSDGGGSGSGNGSSGVIPSGNYNGAVGGKPTQSETIIGGTNVGMQTTEESVQPSNKRFSDLENHWAKECVEELANAGIINGISESTFEPDSKIKRAEFCALIYRALGFKESNGEQKFNDVSSDKWYYGAVQAIAEKGIINGDGQNFNPEKEITRQEMAKIVWGVVSDKVSKPSDSSSKYNDDSQISEWAKVAVEGLSSCKILEGSNGEFRPLSNMTRAEAATVISRIIKLVNGGK